MTTEPTGRSARWGWRIAIAIALVLAGAALAWAALTVLRPAEDPLEAPAATVVPVEQGRIGSSISLNTTAEWTTTPLGINRASGVVTRAVVEAGDEVSPGDVLYEVDLKPVAIAEGEVPSFRQIKAGTTGEDVQQLQRLLEQRGHFSGTANGTVGKGTVAAIRAWQEELGVPATGVVGPGDVIYVPQLPTRVSLDEEFIRTGATLSGGEDALQGLPPAPAFEMPVTTAQAAMVPTGARVIITSPEGDTWAATAGGQSPDEGSGTVHITLDSLDEGPVCADQCTQVPVTGQSSLRSEIITVQEVSGLVVPSSALITEAGGQTAVIDESGSRLPVEVTASAKGMSVITGVDAGTKVQVPAQRAAQE